MIKVISSVKEMLSLRRQQAHQKASTGVGFVPTMGALHSGHIKLIENSQKENSLTIVSIFVNPTQFNNQDDFQKYPKTFERDLELLKNNKVDYLFYPQYEELYQDNYKYKIVETDLSKKYCGQYRPGHFDGVLTVVLKLLNIIKPDRAYFGEKDYQQLKLIEGLVDAFFLDTQIISIPTERDEFGLALSSRNERLSPAGLDQAREFASILKNNKNLEIIRNELQNKNIQIEYLENLDERKLAAVFIENVRLIDNV